jgi:hypothetical protein
MSLSNGAKELPDDPHNSGGKRTGKIVRAGMDIAASAIPIFGGLLSAAASAWSEHEQDRFNEFMRAALKMVQEEMREKYRVIGDVMARLDFHDEQVRERVRSSDYQKLFKKALRNWAGTESLDKQKHVRNLLANAAAARIVSDDVVTLFLDWLHKYSELHFLVVAEIYQRPGVTRSDIWSNLGKPQVREDSAEADLFKLLIRDLSQGGVIRQHRETDYNGNYLRKVTARSKPGHGSSTMKSAFDDTESYELTELGRQFIHYVMTDLPIKITYQPEDDSQHSEEANANDAL